MTAQRRLVPDAEIKRVFAIAHENGMSIGGLEVGRDYVRITPAQSGENELAQWVNRPPHSQKEAEKR